MTYAFDIDGTICSLSVGGKYEQHKPFVKRIKKVNKLYEKGYKIVLFTARGSTTGIDWRELTEKQLKKWGVKYHELVFGKPEYDLYIGDKAINADLYFEV